MTLLFYKTTLKSNYNQNIWIFKWHKKISQTFFVHQQNTKSKRYKLPTWLYNINMLEHIFYYKIKSNRTKNKTATRLYLDRYEPMYRWSKVENNNKTHIANGFIFIQIWIFDANINMFYFNIFIWNRYIQINSFFSVRFFPVCCVCCCCCYRSIWWYLYIICIFFFVILLLLIVYQSKKHFCVLCQTNKIYTYGWWFNPIEPFFCWRTSNVCIMYRIRFYFLGEGPKYKYILYVSIERQIDF